MTKSTYDLKGCLNCERCAQLLIAYESLKMEQVINRMKLDRQEDYSDAETIGRLRSKADELDTRRMEARETYVEHWELHRSGQKASPSVMESHLQFAA
jgi:hypothetical protein